MKILAIRGENLASLHGPFEVDLEAEPLAGAGVFAIVGRTGAGKSTLLDALCLALYDETPRLAEAKGKVAPPGAGEAHTLQANDVRGVLRRGQGEGHAQVDFLGVDGHRYRATWAVRRARKRPDGRLQQQTLTLEDLDTGDALGATRTEVKAAIEARVGLGFDQFHRSVLLPQGDFAAFLKAEPDARARLLERLVGGEIYTRLSVAAHARAREAGQAVKALELRLDEGAPLEPADRADLEARHQAAARALAQARQALKAAEATVAWHQRDAALADRLTQAQAGLEAAQATWEAAAPDRARHTALQAAEPLRGVFEAAAHSAETAAQRRTAQAHHQAEVASAEAAAQGAEAQARQAADGLETAEAHWAGLQPQLEAARALDVRLAELRKARDRGAPALERLGQELTALDTRHRAAVVARDQAARARDEATGWLDAHPELALLAGEWTRWRDLLGRLEEATTALVSLAAAMPEQHRALEAALGEVSALATALAQAETALSEARAARAAAEAAVSVRPVAALDRRLDEHAAHLKHLAELRAVVQAAASAHQEGQAAQGRVQTAQAAAEAARAEAEGHARDHAATQRVLAEARSNLQQVRATLDLSEHRAALTPGAPCPLCGSPEHPYAEEAPALQSLVQSATQRVGTLEAQVATVDRQQAAAEARAEAEDRAAAEARQGAESQAQILADLGRRWRTAVAQSGLTLPEAPEAPEAHAALTEAEAAAEAQGTALRADREARVRLANQAQAYAQAVEAAATARDQARERLRATEDTLRDLEARAERDQDALARAVGEQARCLADLGPVLTALGGEAAVREAPGAARDTGAGRVADFQGQQQAQARHGQAAEAHTAEAQGLAGRLEALGAQAKAAAAEAEALERQEAELQAERAACLSGEVDAVVRSQTEALQAARARAAETQQAAGTAREHLAGARAALTAAQAARQAAEGDAATAEGRLDQALADAPFDRATLAGLLAQPMEALRRLEAELAALDRQRHAAEVQVDERREALAAHREAPPAQPDPAAARAAVDAASAQAQAEDDRRTGLKGQLDEDDRRRARQAEVGAALEVARATASRWQALSDLIGSHDGKRLRTFAQGLTLEALVALANEQLRQLSGRYRLMRVPGTDLELQVIDRDMADEVRAVHSLSGGETFVVSLALALALSSLAAADTRIESLFVDEGFGALDPHTLDQVLATLDALHATGRQVGVISHVPAIADRVAARVEVEALGAGRSRLTVRAA